MPHPRIERAHRISHDIRTPLTVIKEYASILRDELVGDLNERQRSMLEVIDDRTEDVRQMVENLLLLEDENPRLQQADRRRFSLRQLLGRLQQSVQGRVRRNQLDLVIDWRDQADKVFADESLVELLFRNILGVALRQRANGDQIRLSFRLAGDSVQFSTSAVLDSDAQQHSDAQQQPRRVSQLGVSGEIAERIAVANFGDLDVAANSKIADPTASEVQVVGRLPADGVAAITRSYVAWSAKQRAHNLSKETDVVCLRIGDSVNASRFEGMVRFMLEAGELVIPAPCGALWYVLASRSESRPAFLSRIDQMASDLNRQADYRAATSRVCLADGAEPLLASFEQLARETISNRDKASRRCVVSVDGPNAPACVCG